MSYEVPKYVKPKCEDYDDNMCDFDLELFRQDRIASEAGQDIIAAFSRDDKPTQ